MGRGLKVVHPAPHRRHLSSPSAKNPMEAVLSRLISEGLLEDAGAKRVRSLLAEGKPLDEAILAADGVAEDKMLRLLGSVFDIPYVDLEPLTLSKEFLTKFPARILIQHHILPIEEKNGVVVVATSKVFDLTPLDELRLACGRDVRPVLSPANEIDRCMKRFLGVGADTLQTLVSV